MENKLYFIVFRLFSLGLLCFFVLRMSVWAQVIQVDDNLPVYEGQAVGISGNLNSVGSDTMNNLLTLWAEEFRRIYPSINLQIEGKGSSTAPPALIEGAAQLGPMSRKMKTSEIEKFEKKYGFPPTQVRVVLDALSVFVNKDNPITGLSLSEVDAVFSTTRKGGHREDALTWKQIGLTGDWANRRISLYGRNSASGTYGYFKQAALFKGDFKKTVKEQPGSASVVQAVSEEKYAIGYSGVGFLTSGVRNIPLAKKKGAKYYEPNYKNVLSGKYPLTRTLSIYVVKPPRKELDPLVHEFLKFILSKKGQEIVVKDGYLPLPDKFIRKQLQELHTRSN